MILKYMKHEIKLITRLKYSFVQAPKKRTQPPKYTRQKPQHRIDPKDIDYSKIPEDVKKGVKAYVQAKNILVTSEAELQTMTLRQVILEQREKFMGTLEQTGQTRTVKVETQSSENAQKKEDESYYDLMKAIRFTTFVSNGLMAINMVGYCIFYALKKYEYMGFFLGVSVNPSIILLTGLAIGFNAAAWIIIQSLQLSIKNVNELTAEKISLTNCSPLMYMQALSIAGQTAALSYYLMQPHPFTNIWYLIGAFGLSQVHLSYSILRATNGYKFQLFSKLLITQISVGLLLIFLTYSLLKKIQESQNVSEVVLNSGNVTQLNEVILLTKGYKRFLQEFKEKKISVFKGETINQIINEQLK